MKTDASPLRLVHSAPAKRQSYVFHLYIAGASPNSIRAVECVKRLCEEGLAGRFELNIIDLCQMPELAKRENVIAIPTLVRKFPLPIKRIIGGLSDIRRLLQDHDLKEGR